jgi:hypothetical protein
MARQTIPDILTVAEAYEKTRLDTLRPLAKLLDPDAPTRKTDIVPFLIREMANEERVRQIYDALGPLNQSAIQEAVADPLGMLDPDRFQAKYGQLPGHQTSRVHLFFPQGWWIPRDLLSILRKFVPKPADASVKVTAELPDTVPEQGPRWRYRDGKEKPKELTLRSRSTEGTALREFTTILRLVETGKIRVSDKTRRPSQATVEAIAPLLVEGDFYRPEDRSRYAEDPGYDPAIRTFAWPCILQAAGLVSLSGGRLELSRAGKKALGQPPQVGIRDAWSKWVATKLFDEFERVEAIKGKSTARLSAVADRRRAVSDTLAECPTGAWIAVDEFCRFLKASGNDFPLAHVVWKLYIAEHHYGNFGYYGGEVWHLLQGRFILAMLFEYAATLGLIDVAYIPPQLARNDFRDRWGTDDYSCLSRYDGLKFFRLTPLGAWCLGVAEDYQPEETTPRASWRVLPNFEVVSADRRPDPADAMFLDRVAERTSEAVWRLDRDKILARVEEGLKIDEVADFLRAHASDSMPLTVSTFLDDLRKRTEQLRDLGTVRMIECADPETARMLLLDPKLNKLCEAAGKRGLVFRTNVEPQVRAQLRKLGYVLPST